MRITFAPSFTRELKKLLRRNPELEALVKDKIQLFQLSPQHASLDTHKLGGALRKAWSFSVTHNIRIVFIRQPNGDIYFTDIGDHDHVY